jgi:hypothetical protein
MFAILMMLVTLPFLVCVPTLVITGIVGVVTSDYELFKKVLKFFGWNALALFLIVTIWGILHAVE